MFADGDILTFPKALKIAKSLETAVKDAHQLKGFSATRNNAQCSITVSQERGMLPLWDDKPQGQQL